MAWADEIRNRDFSVRAAYGISIMGPEYEETMIFDYIAGFPVEDGEDELPEGLKQFTIPDMQYAIYRWIEQSIEFVVDLSKGNFNFELYGEEFMPDQGSEKFYIYVPIKKK